MDSNQSPTEEAEALAKIDMTPERMKEIVEQVMEWFNHGDSKTEDVMRLLAQKYQGLELVFASMGYHNLIVNLVGLDPQ